MNERKLIGVSFCITYVVLTAACFALVRFGVVTNCYAQAYVLELPIWIQLTVAKATGLYPVLQELSELTHWGVPYAIVYVGSLCPLYRLGCWVARIDEEALAREEASRLPPQPELEKNCEQSAQEIS